ncbi:MAG: dicarboxylate/amino acid:cation symporter [Alcanivoracaceae bacterium]|nr:dicarboxylate/amino acid:cation symporter [Alcanivoracaceae bacterium]
MRFHNQIFIALILGAVVGALTSADTRLFGIQLLAIHDTVGSLFVNALKMVVVPLITSALIAAMINMAGGRDLGRLGIKTLTWYFATTTLAVLTALVLFNVMTPGIVDGQPAGERLGLATQTDAVVAGMAERGAGDFAGIILQLFPPNIIQAGAEGQLLGLIVFSILFGMFLRNQQGQAAETLKQVIVGFYDTMVAITLFIVRFAPIGVYALIARTVTQTGYDAIEPLAWFFFTVLIALFIHAFVVLPILIRLLARRSPGRHIQAMTPALLTAFSSASSSATLPLTMECTEQRAGVSNRTTSFVLPLGATVNMDGTALYECAAVLFIAQAYGLDLSLSSQALIVVVAILTSIGVAGIPSASLVAITLILTTVGLPAEAIGLILATDRILDMARTAVNIWGDSVGAVIIGRSEGEEGILDVPVSEMEQRHQMNQRG